MRETILLVEDNPHIMEINREVLADEDYRVLEAVDGKTCMALLSGNDVDLIVLDIMLPDADRLELCARIKARYDVPILFLTALGENAQIIDGLRAGGDDYLAKPYDIGVLLARIEARLRAGRNKQTRFVNRRGLRLDTVSMQACAGERELGLAQKEYLLLLTLLQSRDEPTDKDALYETVWGASAAGDHSALYTAVSRLNKKLDGAELRVAYRRGAGYSLEED